MFECGQRTNVADCVSNDDAVRLRIDRAGADVESLIDNANGDAPALAAWHPCVGAIGCGHSLSDAITRRRFGATSRSACAQSAAAQRQLLKPQCSMPLAVSIPIAHCCANRFRRAKPAMSTHVRKFGVQFPTSSCLYGLGRTTRPPNHHETSGPSVVRCWSGRRRRWCSGLRRCPPQNRCHLLSGVDRLAIAGCLRRSLACRQ